MSLEKEPAGSPDNGGEPAEQPPNNASQPTSGDRQNSPGDTGRSSLNILAFMAGKDRRKRPSGPVTPPRPPAPPGHITPYAAAAVEDECSKLAAMPPKSGRNHRLNKAAFALASLVYAGEVEEQYVRDRLLDACNTNGVLGEDGLRQCEETIDSGFQGAAAKVGARQIKPLEEIAPAATFTPAAGSGDGQDSEGGEDSEPPPPTTWEPVDPVPYLDGTYTPPEPCVGMTRIDGQALLYEGRENVIVGETEGGKTWFALGCAAAEIRKRRNVLYVHYEESNPSSTYERLMLLGVTRQQIIEQFTFVGPTQPLLHSQWLGDLLTNRPTLVIHDGVNEAMSLQGNEIKDADGAATFRRKIIKPCLAAGAATLACDHIAKSNDHQGKQKYMSYGSVHKLNAVDGAAFLLESNEPFGRGRSGRSYLSLLKDRPGELRRHGKVQGPGRTFMGTLIVDDEPGSPFSMVLSEPREEVEADPADPVEDPGGVGPDFVDEVFEAIKDKLPLSQRDCYVYARELGGIKAGDSKILDALNRLVVRGKLDRNPDGPRKSNIYSKAGELAVNFAATAAATAAGLLPEEPTATAAATAATTAAATAAPIEGAAVRSSRVSEHDDCCGSSPQQSAAVEGNEEKSLTDKPQPTPVDGPPPKPKRRRATRSKKKEG